MELKEYMNGSFPGVILKSSMYFQWENHLHFDFGIGKYQFPTLYPRLGSKQEISYPDVFFVNATKDIIMFIYDDRGCEVIAKNKEIIRYLYEKYKNWIPCYERESIDDLFK